MSHFHAVVWIDHAEAKIFEFAEKAVERKHVKNAHAQHLHHKAGAIGAGKAAVDAGFLKDITAGLADAGEILVVGPGSAKLDLIRHLHRHAAAVEAKVVGVESADHPTDGQVVAHARAYFAVKDRTLPQH